jgi:hypothetical protein
LGGTAAKFMPAGVVAAAVPGDPVGPGLPTEQAASADPDPAASTVTPRALNSERRDIARRAMSPKYSLSLVLGAGWAQASPHR